MPVTHHSRVGSSNLHRYIRGEHHSGCTGALLLENEYPPEPASAPALEGDRAHSLLESSLIDNINTDEYVPAPIGDLVVDDNDELDEDMLIYVQEALDEIRKIVPSDRRHEILTERRVEFEDVVPDPTGSGGTMDVAWYDHETHTLYLWDLKYGYIVVDSYMNPQLMIGAHGFMRDHQAHFPRDSIKHLKLTILQPRKALFDTFETTPNEIRMWTTNTVTPDITRALDPFAEPVFSPSERNCEFCRARHDCIARRTWVDHTAMEGFEQQRPRLRDVHAMSDRELGQAYLRADAIEKWAQSVKALAAKRVRTGHLKIEGYAIQETKGVHRKFKGFVDDVTLCELLNVERDALYNSPGRRKSVAKIEKLLPPKKDAPELWEQWRNIIHKPTGTLVLKPVREGEPVSKDITDGFEAQTKTIDNVDQYF